jgi:hypothetical protein
VKDILTVLYLDVAPPWCVVIVASASPSSMIQRRPLLIVTVPSSSGSYLTEGSTDVVPSVPTEVSGAVVSGAVVSGAVVSVVAPLSSVPDVGGTMGALITEPRYLKFSTIPNTG